MKEDELEIIECLDHEAKDILKDILLSGKEILYHFDSSGRPPLEKDHTFFLKKAKK